MTNHEVIRSLPDHVVKDLTRNYTTKTQEEGYRTICLLSDLAQPGDEIPCLAHIVTTALYNSLTLYYSFIETSDDEALKERAYGDEGVAFMKTITANLVDRAIESVKQTAKDMELVKEQA